MGVTVAEIDNKILIRYGEANSLRQVDMFYPSCHVSLTTYFVTISQSIHF